jgi:ATP-dependent Clp protease ATP-binding subunit ClpA
MFERFTPEARQILCDARGQAIRLGHDWIGCEHLLLALAASDSPAGEVVRDLGATPAAVEGALLAVLGTPSDSLDGEALAAIGIDLEAVRERVEAAFGPGALSRPRARRGSRWRRPRRECPDIGPGRRPFTPRARKCLELSRRQAEASAQALIGMEHLAWELLSIQDGLARRILAELRVSPAEIRSAIAQRYRQAG